VAQITDARGHIIARMIEFTRYAGTVREWRGSWGGLPPWARGIVDVFALPGVILLALSFVGLLVSLLALLVLTVPVYVGLRSLTAPRRQAADAEGGLFVASPSPGSRKVEATIIE
jgi:hypothetical protein